MRIAKLTLRAAKSETLYLLWLGMHLNRERLGTVC